MGAQRPESLVIYANKTNPGFASFFQIQSEYCKNMLSLNPICNLSLYCIYCRLCSNLFEIHVFAPREIRNIQNRIFQFEI